MKKALRKSLNSVEAFTCFMWDVVVKVGTPTSKAIRIIKNANLPIEDERHLIMLIKAGHDEHGCSKRQRMSSFERANIESKLSIREYFTVFPKESVIRAHVLGEGVVAVVQTPGKAVIYSA